MARRADVVRRLLGLAALAWVGRWAALELAAYAGRHWLPRGRPSKESPRQPGRMPGPFDR
jgi:hypothetical protein